MQCTHCSFDNPPGSRFCGQCGEALRRACPACGTANDPGFKFCTQCGAALAVAVETSAAAAPTASESAVGPAATPASERPAASGPGAGEEALSGERKRAAVLFCRLAVEEGEGVVAAERELARMQRFLATARKALEPFEAWIQTVPGKGLSAFFGAPVSIEDFPQRSVLAALELQRAIGDDPKLAGAESCMGLDVGGVVVSQQATTIVGSPARTAERLQELALGGEMLISGRLAELVEGLVESEELGREELESRGWPTGAESSPPLRLLRLRPEELRRPVTGRIHAGRFVGRRHELETLLHVARQADAGHGQVVGIAGPAGVGKSRLLQEFGSALAELDALHLRTECRAYGEQIPYLPLVSLVRAALGGAIPEDAAELGELLVERGIGDPETAVETARFLAVFLKLPKARTGVAGVEPFVIQRRLFEVVRTLLLALGEERLLVLEIEDLHWVDATSETLLASLIEQLSAARLLILLSYRSGYRPPWSQLSYFTQIALRRLSAEESREIVGDLVGDAPGNGSHAAEVSKLLAKADGNPLFVLELARSLRDSDSENEPLPDTLQGLLMSRVDRMPAVYKDLLRTASVLGEHIDLELLERVWQRPEELPPLLDELQRQEFLAQVPGRRRGAYVFQHALMREVVYESQLEDERRRLHRLAGTTLERLHSDRPEEVSGRLVYHFRRADRPEKTVRYLTRLAAQAVESFSHPEAAAALCEAIEHADGLEEARKDRRILELTLQLCASLFPLARFGETLELLERQRARLESVGDRELDAGFHFWLAHTHSYLGNSEAAVENAEVAIAAAQECGDQATEGKASYVLGRDGFWSGRFTSGAERSLRAIVLLERSGEPWWQGQAHWVAGFNRFVLGEVEEALEELARAQRISEALDDYRVDPSWSIGYMRAALGDPETGLEVCRAALEGSRDPLNSAIASGFLGFAHLELGEPEAAKKALLEAVDRMSEAGMRQLEGWFSAYLAEAELALGELEAAARSARRAVEVTRQVRFEFGEVLATRALALVLARRGQAEASLELLQRAVEECRRLEIPLMLSQTLIDSARLLAAGGRLLESQEAAAEAAEALRRLELPRLAERAEALRRELDLDAAAGGRQDSGQGVSNR